ncbi:MAG: hypothetical protein WAM82_22605 [Thermoanaerobaculia bacterium]
MNYVVSYDLDHGTREEYEAIENNLTARGGVHWMKSTWKVPSTVDAKELLKSLKSLVGANGKMYVGAISADADYLNLQG